MQHLDERKARLQGEEDGGGYGRGGNSLAVERGPQAHATPIGCQFDAKSKLTRALYLAYMYAGQRSLPRLLCHLQVLGLVPVNL